MGGTGLTKLFLGEQLLLFERRVFRVENDVILEVDHLLEARRLHFEQRAQPAGHRLEKPDVHDRRGQFDVAHPLAAHATVRDLHAAAVADHALVFHPPVLAAGAFPVLLRSEDLFAHQAVLFRTEGAVIDRLGLFDLAERPAANVVRPGQADLHSRIVVDAIVGGFTDAHVSSPFVLCRNRSDKLLVSTRLLQPAQPARQTRLFSSCMFNARPRISLVSTSKLAGVPASSVFSPLTMLS